MVGADPADQRGVIQRVAQHATDLLEIAITRLVARGLVNDLEVIQVHVDHRAGFVVAQFQQGVGDLTLELPAVEQAGDRVDAITSMQLSLGLAQPGQILGSD